MVTENSFLFHSFSECSCLKQVKGYFANILILIWTIFRNKIHLICILLEDLIMKVDSSAEGFSVGI